MAGAASDPPREVVDDVLLRFVYTLPPDAQRNPVELFFSLERAWWLYEDSVRHDNPEYKHFSGYAQFISMLLTKSPKLRQLIPNFPAAHAQFKEFKNRIPVYGAVLMDSQMEKVLLVRGLHQSSAWCFPRGKVNKDEDPMDCAAREVFEETGYDISRMIKAQDYVTTKLQEKECRLYLVPGVDPSTAMFAPQLPGEIGAYGWYYLHELPCSTTESDAVYLASGMRAKFYAVAAVIRQLKGWVSRRRRELGLPPPPWDSSQDEGQQVVCEPSPHLSVMEVQTGLTGQQVTSVQDKQRQHGVMAMQARSGDAGMLGPADTQSFPVANLVMSADFRFDRRAVLQSLAVG